MPKFSERQIEDFVDLLESQVDKVRKDYSGRGMYGKSCVGFVTSDVVSSVASIVTAAHEEARNFDKDERGDELIDIVEYAFNNASTDSMGYDTIVYFSGVNASHLIEEEVEEEDEVDFED